MDPIRNVKQCRVTSTIYLWHSSCVKRRNRKKHSKTKLTKNAEHIRNVFHTIEKQLHSSTNRKSLCSPVHADRYFRCHPLAEKAKCEVVNGRPCTGADGRGFSVLFPFFRFIATPTLSRTICVSGITIALLSLEGSLFLILAREAAARRWIKKKKKKESGEGRHRTSPYRALTEADGRPFRS